MSVGSTLRAFLFSSLFFASPAAGFETEVESDPPSFIAGPDGQMRILVALPFMGSCDVLWCDDPECTGGCAEKWPFLTEYCVEIELDGKRASRTIELAAFPITSYWDPRSVTWDGWNQEYLWHTPGGDLFYPAQSRSYEVLSSGEKKKWLEFSLEDAVREASREGLTVYGFALTAPVPLEDFDLDAGLSAQEIGALGQFKSIHFRMGLDLGPIYPPPPLAVIDPCPMVIDPTPPPVVVVLPPSDWKDKDHHLPTGKPTYLPPHPPPPPPPPSPPPPPRTPIAEVKAPEPPSPPARTPVAEVKAPEPPAAVEKEDPPPPEKKEPARESRDDEETPARNSRAAAAVR